MQYKNNKLRENLPDYHSYLHKLADQNNQHAKQLLILKRDIEEYDLFIIRSTRRKTFADFTLSEELQKLKKSTNSNNDKVFSDQNGKILFIDRGDSIAVRSMDDKDIEKAVLYAAEKFVV